MSLKTGNKKEQKKILLCDDDETLVDVMQLLLQAEGYSVETALDGNDGLSKYAHHKPDLLILDLDMPHKTGFDVLEALLSGGRPAGSSLMVLSAVEKPSEMKRAKKLGADHFFTKPFETTELIKQIHSILGTAVNGTH